MAEMEETKVIKDPKDIKGDKDDYDPRRKREIIKTILIVFLAVLLILTFFSNTIRNKSLSEISTERATSGKLTERIRGGGTVESNQSYGVTVEGNKVVDTVKVKSGQKVKKDDVLLIVGTGENEAITTAQAQLDELELDYKKALLAPPKDYAAEDQAIKVAREDLTALIEKRDKLAADQGNIEAAAEENKYNKSQYSYYKKLSEKLSAAVAAVDSDNLSEAPAEYTGELIELKNKANKAQASYMAAKEIYMSMFSSVSQGDDDESGMARGNGASEKDIAAAKADMDKKEEAYNSAYEAYEDKKNELRSDWVDQLSDAEYNFEYYGELLEEAGGDGEGPAVTVESLDAEIKEKQRTLESLLIEYAKTQQTDNAQNKVNGLDLDAQKKEIDKLKKKIKELKEKNEATEIKSKYSGVVSAVNVKAGDETVPDTEVITIDISEEGYTVQVTVDGKQSTKIKKGTAAEVVNNWSGKIDAVVSDIRNDTVANSKNRILVFSVTGDVESGSYLEFSIPCGSGTYDAIVPKSAVYTDNDGSFVLTVNSKSSPLGNRYYAQRVPVEVLISDELSSAVSGDISYGDYVITAASKPVKPGDQVRMKDK